MGSFVRAITSIRGEDCRTCITERSCIWQVRVKCPHCSIILDLPVSTTKFKCAKCAAISNITAASQASTPEEIFEKAQKTEAIIAPAGKTTSDRVLLQQLLGHLILEIRDLKRRNVDDDAVKLESGPKLEEAVQKKADLDGDGIITEAELREVYGQKEDPNVTKLKEMVLQADLDGDGVVSRIRAQVCVSCIAERTMAGRNWAPCIRTMRNGHRSDTSRHQIMSRVDVAPSIMMQVGVFSGL